MKKDGTIDEIKSTVYNKEEYITSEPTGDKGVLVMVCDPIFDNRVYFDENNELRGTDIYIAKEICNYLGYNLVVETKGFIYGLTVRSRGVGGQFGAGIKSIFGGEITQYVTMMEESRDEALKRAIDHAKELGANGIVAIRFDSNEISDVMQEILVYGTAVVVEKE